MGMIRVYSMMLQPLLSVALSRILEDMSDCIYMGNSDHLDAFRARLAADGSREVAADASTQDCNILVIDFHPEEEELQRSIKRLRHDFPDLAILVFLPMLSDRSVITGALRWGADAYVLSTVTPDVLCSAIVELGRGRSFLGTEVTPIVLDEMRRPLRKASLEASQVGLTERDRLLLQLAADGLSNVQIADVLGLAEKTVRNAWSQLFERTGISDRTQAVLWAIRSGEVELR